MTASKMVKPEGEEQNDKNEPHQYISGWIDFAEKFTDFQLIQDANTGEIYAIRNPEKISDEVDHGKEILEITPEAWGSLKVAKIDPKTQEIIKVERMITKQDIDSIGSYLSFLEGQFTVHEMQEAERLASRYVDKKMKEEKKEKEKI